jgi:alkylation response protein AidB-like acyl-CoA dehydrogenase
MAFSAERQQLQEGVRDFLVARSPLSAIRTSAESGAGYDRTVWKQMAEQLGLHSLAIPVKYGGSGFGFAEQAVVLTELGRALYNGPFLSTVIMAATALGAANDDDAAERWLPLIASGELIACVALIDGLADQLPRTGSDVTATPGPDGFVLSGSVRFVLDADSAELILVFAHTDRGVGLFACEAGQPGVTVEVLPSLDLTMSFADVSMSSARGVLVGDSATGPAIAEEVLSTATIALAALQLGGAARTLEIATDYAKVRTQFGQPIGSFQAIKHLLADVHLETQAAEAAVEQAALAVDERAADLVTLAHLVGAFTSDTYVDATRTAIQTVGGIATTWEHDLQMFYKRAMVSSELFGPARRHRSALADHLLAASASTEPAARRRREVALPARAEAFRAEVRDFLTRALPSDWNGVGALDPEEREQFLLDWRRTIHDERMIAVAWPEAYGGRGLGLVEHVVLAQEFARAQVPSGTLNDDFGIRLLGNTMVAWGTEEQKRHFLPRILSGEYVFCQGFSEPNAGSDLASLTTRAERDGNQWIINGQKIWTTAAHTANWIFMLVRTSGKPDRHRGLSFLLCNLDQPGAEVRPIRMLSGMQDYNEVFFSDVRASANHLVGEVNGGWKVAMSLLSIERGESATTDPDLFRAEFDRVVTLARRHGIASDPVLKQRLASCFTRVEIMRYFGMRTLETLIADGEPGPASSLSKLYISRYHQMVTELAIDIIGIDVLAPTGELPFHAIGADIIGSNGSDRSWVATHLNARAGTIYGGSAQIQRNIIGEQLLGLPRPSHH